MIFIYKYLSKYSIATWPISNDQSFTNVLKANFEQSILKILRFSIWTWPIQCQWCLKSIQSLANYKVFLKLKQF
jgi:hypothetical protein